MKKLLSILLSLALLLMCIPLGAITVSAETSGDYTYTVTDGAATIADYLGAGGDISIPATLGGYPVTTIGFNAFENCSSLTSVTIPDSVTSIMSWAFFNCTSLTTVTIPDGVTTILYQAFSNCTSLTSVTIPDSVTTIGELAFNNCTSLTAIQVAEGNADYCDIEGVLYNKDQTRLIQCPGGKAGAYTIPDSVTSIGWCAFSNCSSLSSVTIPDSVTAIGFDAFYNCTSLTDVYYGGSEVDKLNITFEDGNASLLNATWHYNTLVEGDYAYTVTDGAATITDYLGAGGDITIPATLGGYPVTTIGDLAFIYCTSLTLMTIPDSVTSIGEAAFLGCAFLKEVSIPDSVTTIGGFAFAYCTSLTTVTIPDSVTAIGYEAFSSCTSLTTVTIPDSVTAIGEYAFAECTSLTSMTIPNSLVTIRTCMFSGCTSLTSITIPGSITTVEAAAFYDCPALTDVYYGGTQADKANISTIGGGNDAFLNATWHYTCINPKDHHHHKVHHSVMETDQGHGFAFRFGIKVNVGYKNGNRADYTNATVNYLGKICRLVGMGAMVTNDDAVGRSEAAFTREGANSATVKDVPTVYLNDWEEGDCAFATRVVNIPDSARDRTIYSRPYYIVEVDGEQVVIYGDIHSGRCSDYL